MARQLKPAVLNLFVPDVRRPESGKEAGKTRPVVYSW
jgi:hypothetical protein